MDFTIDQQPYLQGFLPILELYLSTVSKTLSGMADVNTGLKFLDKTTVVPYNSTKSRYEGTSKSVGLASSDELDRRVDDADGGAPVALGTVAEARGAPAGRSRPCDGC